MPLQVFVGEEKDKNILRVYSLRLSYEFCRQLDKDKSISAGLASLCTIIRKKPIVNNTEFGYREELKPAVLKKMHFVYLEKIQDLFAFIYEHIRHLKGKDSQTQLIQPLKSELVSNSRPKALFGMLIIENLEDFLGEIFSYAHVGRQMLLLIKLLKSLEHLMPFNSNICFTYNYRPGVFQFQDFLSYIKSEDVNCWKVEAQGLQKNGYMYQSEWTRRFYSIYTTGQEEGQ